jgi:dipeptidyl aminopeptidase/acylaminoacyl peptidase
LPDKQTAPSASQVAPYLAIPSATTPAWFSDTRLAYLVDVSGVPQLWRIDLPDQGGSEMSQPRPMTTFADRIGALFAAPCGGRVVFGMDTGGDERQQLWTIGADDTPRALTADPGTIHTLGAVSSDGQRVAFANNARDRQFFDVWTLDVNAPDATPRLVMATDELLTPLAWTADGGALIVQRANTNLDHDLFLVPADGGPVRLLTPHTGEASISRAIASPHGDALYLLSNQDREFTALIHLDLATLDRTVLAGPDWDIEALALAPAGDWLAYSVNEDGYSRLVFRELATGREHPVNGAPPGVASAPQWSPDGTRLAFALNGPQNPSTIWIADRDGQAKLATPTGPAQGELPPFVAPETIRFPTFDGRSIPAFWYRPPGNVGPAPVVVDVHGGPESQRRPDFAPVTQALVAGGIAVLATNVRGSTGYGKTYCHLDDRDRRYDAVKDLAAATAWLRDRPEVAADRIAVMGQSYGGFMVLAALTTYPNIWAAGVDVVGIANFVTFLEQTGPWRRRTRAAEYGELPDDADLLREISPIHRAEQITAPLFVIHGRNDPRVPLGEAEQIVARLRALGRDVESLVFDDEGHGLVKRANRLAGYGSVADFLARRLFA